MGAHWARCMLQLMGAHWASWMLQHSAGWLCRSWCELCVCVWAMVRFNKAKASSAAGGSAAAVPEKKKEVLGLAELTSMRPLPLGTVCSVGRVIYVFGFTPGTLV